MAEQIALKSLGATTAREVMANTDDAMIVPVILAGGSALDFIAGQVVRDGSVSGLKYPYTNGDLDLTITDGVATAGSLTVLTTATFNPLAAGVKPGDTFACTGGGGGTKTVSAVTAGSITVTVAFTADTGISAVLTRTAAGSLGLGLAVLAESSATTVADGNVTANAFLTGTLRKSKVVDSTGAALDAGGLAVLAGVKRLLLLA